MSKQEILQLVKSDLWMMDVLQVAQSVSLPDWWIGAGFVRNKVWDVLHGFEHTPLNDVDLIYFDESNVDESFEKQLEARLRKLLPEVPWSVKNQARMAIVRQDGKYKSALDGLSRWVETATCIGVQLGADGQLKLVAPHGVDDLLNLILRPTPAFANNLTVFDQRIKEKQWLIKWPKLKVEYA